MPDCTGSRSTSNQFLRYAVVGAVSNLSGYLVYLLLTYAGLEPKATMTLLYGTGATIAYFGNRTLTFSYKGAVLGSGVRYSLSHLVGYLINLTIIVIFVDRLGYPHQIVQAVAILFVATFLCFALKFIVFKVAA
jgi:putative flippase GtrA